MKLLPDLPPAIARDFLADMRAYFAEKDPIRRDAIAARQLEPLNGQLRPGQRRLKIPHIKAMFVEMRDYLEDGQ